MRARIVRRLVICYLIVVGVAVHVALLAGAAFVWRRYGFAAVVTKAVVVVESRAPGRAPLARRMAGLLGVEMPPGRRPGDGIQFPEMSDWGGRGASPDAASTVDLGGDDAADRARRVIDVATVDQLLNAIASAMPGDVISLLPGVYRIDARNVHVDATGLPEMPIVVRARRLGEALIEFDALEGFLVRGPHWHFENLDIRGVCETHGECEHAFHIVGGAQNTVLRNNVMRDFNAAIKGNGLGSDGQRAFPDDVLVEGNSLYNSTVRDTDNPVTPVDVVGANGWVVRGNLIADFAKGGGNRISYAAFFKGNSAHGVFEKNLVICEMNVLDPAADRVGLSFGGGGSSGTECREGKCIPEHTAGVIRNNIIMHCNDAGIYLNRSANTEVLHNTLYNTAGIDVDYPESRVFVANNLLSAVIRDRRGGESTKSHNLTGLRTRKLLQWFVNPDIGDFRLSDGRRLVDRGDESVNVADDFCDTIRGDGFPDIGSIEYSDGTGCDPSRSPR